MRVVSLAAVAAIATLVAAPASAALIVATSTGVVTGWDGADVYDVTGVFGSAGLLLTGQAYTMTTTYDTAGATLVSGGSGSYLTWGGPPNAISELTINGTTFTINATAGSNVLQYGSLGGTLVNYTTSDVAGVHRVFNMSVRNNPGELPANVATSGLGNLCEGGDVCGGTFAIIGNGLDLRSRLSATSYTYTVGDGSLPTPVNPAPDDPVLTVPEPGTWALMILGFGGMGAALRRRRLAHII